LDNALKYSDGTPEIDVRVYADGDLVLEVEDRGPGIPPEKRARIFDPFYRVNPGLAPQGSGLGLALVRHVVESHRGTVEVDAGPEGGSRFVIRLPRQTREEETS
jgi:signal transduction histidine kinase